MSPRWRLDVVYRGPFRAHDLPAEPKGDEHDHPQTSTQERLVPAAVGQVSGTSLRTIQRVEAGATASLETLKSLAAVFEVPLEDLQGEHDMIATQNTVSPQEALAMQQVSQLRGFYIHVVVYVVVCAAALATLFFLSPDKL